MKLQTWTPTRRLFTADEYHHMAEAGILHEDDRVELIGGEIFEMTPIGGRHFTCVNNLTRLLVEGVGSEAVVSPQNPVRLGEHQEPQPDLAVVRSRNYRDSLPTPEDVLLLIEVADTSLAYDREVKLPLYSRSGIPEAWIVDLTGESIERHTDPSETGYRLTARAGRGKRLESLSLPGLVLDTNTVLG